MRTVAAMASITITIIMAMVGTTDTVFAQDRLPAYVRSNSFIAGQVLGCALRYETYYSETVRRAAELGRTLPPNYQLNLIAGLDVAALREDARQALLAQSSPESPIEEVIAAISEIAVAEDDGATAGAPGYHEAWAQAAACSTMFGQLGLFEAYR